MLHFELKIGSAHTPSGGVSSPPEGDKLLRSGEFVFERILGKYWESGHLAIFGTDRFDLDLRKSETLNSVLQADSYYKPQTGAALWDTCTIAVLLVIPYLTISLKRIKKQTCTSTVDCTVFELPRVSWKVFAVFRLHGNYCTEPI